MSEQDYVQENLGGVLASDVLSEEDGLTTRVGIDKVGKVVHEGVDHNPEVVSLVVLGGVSRCSWEGGAPCEALNVHTLATSSRE